MVTDYYKMREIIEKYCKKGHAYDTFEGENISCPECEEDAEISKSDM